MMKRSPPPSSTRRWRRWVRAFGVLAALGIAAALLRGQLPKPADVLAALHAADTRWLLVALAAELVSMGMFARQQRRLLTAFGISMPRHRALALAYSRSAMSISLPAGSVVSAAYAFRQYRVDGAGKREAATVMVLSGLLSVLALALLYGTGMLATAATRIAGAWRDDPGSTSATVLPAAAFLALIVQLAWRSAVAGRTDGKRPGRAGVLDRLAEPFPRSPRLARIAGPVAEAIAGARAVAGRHWGLALAAATANWLTDLLCLAAVARAFHLPLDPVAIAAVYLTVQIVRQVPLTPGGVGVIEVSLLAGLVSAGAGEAAAAATVLGYRLLSCWLIIPAGLLGWLVLRHGSARRTEAQEATSVSPATGPMLAGPNTMASSSSRRGAGAMR